MDSAGQPPSAPAADGVGPVPAHAPVPRRPTEALTNTQSTSAALPQEAQSQGGKRRRNHRAGKKKRTRTQSFMAGTEPDGVDTGRGPCSVAESSTATAPRPPFYKLGQSGRNLSETSLASEALLDHREQAVMRQRRESRVAPNPFGRPSNLDLPSQHRPGRGPHDKSPIRRRQTKAHESSAEESNDENGQDTNDRTPLLAGIFNRHEGSPRQPGYGIFGQARTSSHDPRYRRNSNASSNASKHRPHLSSRQDSTPGMHPIHDVNNPPSVPNSPKLGIDLGYDDVLLASSYTSKHSEERRGDQLIDIDEEPRGPSPVQRRGSMDHRRHTIALTAEEDVCFPVEGMSAIGEDDYHEHGQEPQYQHGQRKRRYRQWPDLSVLDEWSREEKEQQREGTRTKKISEPVLVGGRLRPQKHGWHKEEEDAPYRFTYFNEEFPSTIHSQTISELLQPGSDFKELFIPEPPELSDCSSDEEEILSHQGPVTEKRETSPLPQSQAGTRHPSIIGGPRGPTPVHSGEATPSNPIGPTASGDKPKRYGERPTFWLDVFSPTDTEMRVIAKAFAIHPLTAEDIMMQEAREKVELFRNYYFVNYRTFEQDTNSEEFLQPVNMYVVVFPEGVISFHFSMTPHPANVRRRIRQLRDYIKVSSDWISYAIIDDITDVFGPLIHSIEDEVDDIDEAILKLHSGEDAGAVSSPSINEKASNDGKSVSSVETISGTDMLRRVGEGRKKVMLLYRLLGNKADVIKGFAKRCNEKWDIAPRSDIGLYLGDIQDHILTMTGNLNHYESLLSRAHSNYLAQINIRMNERQEQTADVLGKLTVLGTIVLPMNIVTGMWGMNVQVPGQNVDNLIWFWCITAGLFGFGISCFFIAKRVYGIV